MTLQNLSITVNPINETQRVKSKKNLTKFVGVVVDIILDSSHPDFETLGGYDIIGLIKYRLLESNVSSNVNSFNYALPKNSNVKCYPIIGETVEIVSGLPTRSTNGKESKTFNYYEMSVNSRNSSQDNLFDENSTFPKNENHSQVQGKAGDVIFEGRFQNSIKFTSDEQGNPVTIIRNGRVSNSGDKKFLPEDINYDDSLLIFSSKGSLNLEKKLKFKTFNLKGSKTSSDNNISLPNYSSNSGQINDEITPIVTNDVTQIIEPTVNESDEIVDLPLPSEYDALKDETSDEVIEVISPSVYTVDDVYVQPSSGFEKIDVVNISNYNSYIGKVENSLPISIRAMLDTIAWAEGTIGRGMNGYNIGVGYFKIPNWTTSYTNGCPRIKLTFYNKKTHKVSFTLSKGYWGRYQYGVDTWTSVNGSNKAFTKVNQDLTCAKQIKSILGAVVYDNLHLYMNDINGVYKICEKLGKTWSSIPYGSTNRSFYTLKKNGKTSYQPSRSCKSVQEFYQKCYKLNGGK